MTSLWCRGGGGGGHSLTVALSGNVYVCEAISVLQRRAAHYDIGIPWRLFANIDSPSSFCAVFYLNENMFKY